MDGTSVVLTGDAADSLAAVVPDSIALPVLADDDSWVARTALAISEMVAAGRLRTPLLLVLTGRLARHAPHLGFAQRAARRAVRGYVLVDPELPAPGTVSDWPDAPVTVVLAAPENPQARAAELRGWEVLIGDPASIVTDLLDRP